MSRSKTHAQIGPTPDNRADRTGSGWANTPKPDGTPSGRTPTPVEEPPEDQSRGRIEKPGAADDECAKRQDPAWSAGIEGDRFVFDN